LPTGAAREQLRAKGQFWTPDWIADAMVAYVCGEGAEAIFDPAVGAGAFFQAARRRSRHLRLEGTEVARDALQQAAESGLTAADLRHVDLRDYVLEPPSIRHPAIVANPPYIRHHRLSAEVKAKLSLFSRQFLGFAIDGRAGYHVYFLLRALERLAPGGRLAFILPADVFEGAYSLKLWARLASAYRIEAVISFAPEATPFPGVDTNALILLMANHPPQAACWWSRCRQRGPALRRWIESGFFGEADSLTAVTRPLTEALSTGLSRAPQTATAAGPRLGDLCTVMRGIATGANDFFFLTSDQIRNLGLPAGVFQRAVGRTRDLVGDELTTADLLRLDKNGRPTYLLSLTGDGPMPAALRQYLASGVKMGLSRRALISSRRPWYRMESRNPPPFLFAYLGRRSSRFIRNHAGALPLTGFLCVYPRPPWSVPDRLQEVWKILKMPQTIENLALVGKSYGGGALKVEPRALERLPLPPEASRLLEAAPQRRAQIRMSWQTAQPAC
jgi:hypothetical protein